MAPGRKGKAKNDEIEAAEAQEALSRIDCQQSVSEELLQKVHKLQVFCPSACGTKGSKDNPLCFCGLIPQEGSFRKKGLWQKEPVLGQIGRDPAEDRRKVCQTRFGRCHATTVVCLHLMSCKTGVSLKQASLQVCFVTAQHDHRPSSLVAGVG